MAGAAANGEREQLLPSAATGGLAGRATPINQRPSPVASASVGQLQLHGQSRVSNSIKHGADLYADAHGEGHGGSSAVSRHFAAAVCAVSVVLYVMSGTIMYTCVVLRTPEPRVSFARAQLCGPVGSGRLLPWPQLGCSLSLSLSLQLCVHTQSQTHTHTHTHAHAHTCTHTRTSLLRRAVSVL